MNNIQKKYLIDSLDNNLCIFTVSFIDTICNTNYRLFLLAFFASISFLTANLFVVFLDLEVLNFPTPVALFAIQLLYTNFYFCYQFF